MTFPWEGVSVSFGSLAIAGMAYIASVRANRMANVAEHDRVEAARAAVDANAYSRAQTIYETSMANLERQIANQARALEACETRCSRLEQRLRAYENDDR